MAYRRSTLQLARSNARSVLIYGQEPVLLDTRSRVLRMAGFAVDMAETVAAVAAMLGSETAYGLLVLCHTTADDDRDTLRMLAEKAAIPVWQIDLLIAPAELIATAAAMDLLSTEDAGIGRRSHDL